jgi:hypothetical protein
MPKICYVEKKFSYESRLIISKALEIIGEYESDGYDLTLRQLYYQFVARGLLANKDTEYNKLGRIVSDARLAGLIDWNSITDRTRYLRKNSHWLSPADVIESAAYGYAIDKWKTQPNRVEVWIEKDALIGVVEQVCEPLDIPHFSCRGYTSASEMWVASQRLLGYIKAGQEPIILHLGDHDPSGMDMSRDIKSRLDLFTSKDVTVKRIALNMEQVSRYNPPPNPAKITDSRSLGYRAEFGDESWELDALDPSVLTNLIEKEVLQYRSVVEWNKAVKQEDQERSELEKVSVNWGEVQEFLK